MNERTQDWALQHAEQIRHIAKMTCEVNEHYGKCPCMECIASAREFFVRMTLKK